MYIDDICRDQIRARVCAVLPLGKDVANDLLMRVATYDPAVAVKEIHLTIPLLTQAEPLPEDRPLSDSRIEACHFLTLWKQKYYTPYEGSYERWRLK